MPRNLRNQSSQINSFSNNQRMGLLGLGTFMGGYVTANAVANADVILDAVPELTLQLASGFWSVEYNLNLAIANPAHNIRYQLVAGEGLVTIAGGVTAGRGFLSVNGVAGQEDPVTNVGITVTGGTATAWTSLRISMGLLIDQPGTLAFAFAQNVSGVSNTQVIGGSRVVASWLGPKQGIA